MLAGVSGFGARGDALAAASELARDGAHLRTRTQHGPLAQLRAAPLVPLARRGLLAAVDPRARLAARPRVSARLLRQRGAQPVLRAPAGRACACSLRPPAARPRPRTRRRE